jgi:hypothetical protein
MNLGAAIEVNYKGCDGCPQERHQDYFQRLIHFRLLRIVIMSLRVGL